MMELPQNIQRDIIFDSPAYLGFKIDKRDMTIEGNGKTLDANGKLAHILHIHASNTIINNLSFLGGNTAVVKDISRKEIDFRSPKGSVFEVIDGGAVLITGKSDVTFTDCTFEDNHALMCGGAISNQGSGTVVFKRCTFKSNTAGHTGSAIDNLTIGANTIIKDCIFEDNRSNVWNNLNGPHGQITVFADTKISITDSSFISGSIPFDFICTSDVKSINNEYGERKDWDENSPISRTRRMREYFKIIKKLYWLIPKTFGHVYYKVNKQDYI